MCHHTSNTNAILNMSVVGVGKPGIGMTDHMKGKMKQRTAKNKKIHNIDVTCWWWQVGLFECVKGTSVQVQSKLYRETSTFLLRLPCSATNHIPYMNTMVYSRKSNHAMNTSTAKTTHSAILFLYGCWESWLIRDANIWSHYVKMSSTMPPLPSIWRVVPLWVVTIHIVLQTQEWIW